MCGESSDEQHVGHHWRTSGGCVVAALALPLAPVAALTGLPWRATSRVAGGLLNGGLALTIAVGLRQLDAERAEEARSVGLLVFLAGLGT